MTVDPHPHRRTSLAEIYPLRAPVVHAALRISEWIRANVARPVLVGPDSESEQLVAAIAEQSGAGYVTLEKRRRGDREVEVSVPELMLLLRRQTSCSSGTIRRMSRAPSCWHER